jgi:hypothetical protein
MDDERSTLANEALSLEQIGLAEAQSQRALQHSRASAVGSRFARCLHVQERFQLFPGQQSICAHLMSSTMHVCSRLACIERCVSKAARFVLRELRT